MSQLQKTLESLQPYVIGIRYLESNAIVDAVFKEGWTIPENSTIRKIKGDDTPNYYMFFSEEKTIGLDDLLNHVQLIIGLNQEREKKHTLLKDTVDILKKMFKEKSYETLLKLKFVFDEDDLIPPLSEMSEEQFVEPTVEPTVDSTTVPTELTDESITPINTEGLTEEELEILAEEKRAENFRKHKESTQITTKRHTPTKVELPPKKVMAIATTETGCDCSEDEACPKCIDSKGY